MTITSAISTSSVFHTVDSLGWLAQSGNVAPSRIMISRPQQTFRYTPNFEFTSPLLGIGRTVHPSLNHLKQVIRFSIHSAKIEVSEFNRLSVAGKCHCRKTALCAGKKRLAAM